MQNLQKHRDTQYRYRSAELGPVVNVTVKYDLGGMNPFGGQSDPRGIVVSVSTSTIEKVTDTLCAESFKVFGEKGFNILAVSLARFQPKKLNAVAALIDPLCPEIARLFDAGKGPEAKQLALSALGQSVQGVK